LGQSTEHIILLHHAILNH